MRTIHRAVLETAVCAAMLWSLPGFAADQPGAMPGDDAMTCQQIAAELAPYGNQMSGTVNPLVQTQSELVARNEKRMAEAMPVVAGFAAAGTAASLDPTGLASRALGQAEANYQQAQFHRALAEDKPLMDQANRQTNDMASQAMAMQANPRLQRLMQLAQQKDCH
jgi:hypothetical protein